jgi:hypothetical protein
MMFKDDFDPVRPEELEMLQMPWAEMVLTHLKESDPVTLKELLATDDYITLISFIDNRLNKAIQLQEAMLQENPEMSEIEIVDIVIQQILIPSTELSEAQFTSRELTMLDTLDKIISEEYAYY